MTKLIAHVYGKGHGCAKCDVLKQRLHKILEDPAYADIEFGFSDVLTEDGFVEFLKAGVLNPMRIPAILMQTKEGPDFIFQDHDALGEAQYAASCTGHYLGIQTDYTHGGVIPPAAIKGLLDKAIESTK